MADWDSVWDSVQQEREQRLRAAFAAKPPVQPEAAARANQLSDRLGQPFDVVAANLDEFEQDDRAAHVLEVGRKNPVVGEFLQDPRRAALASDDVDALDRLAGLFSGAAATPLTGMNPLASGLIRPLLEQMGVGARRGAARSEFGETFQREAAATGASAWHAVADFLDQTTQRPAREIFGALATAAEGTDQAAPARALAEGLADPLGVAGQAAQSAAVAGEIEADRAEQAERIGGRPSLDLLRRDPGAWAEQAAAYYANQGTASLPVMLLAIASRRPWLGGGLMGASEAAGTYTELRGEGMDRLTAAGAAAGTGALEAGLGAVGLGAAMRRGLAGMLGGPLIEAGTEGLTTAGQIEVLDFARGQRTDPVEKLMATWDAVVLGLGFGAIERAGSAALDAMTPQQRAETALEDGLRVQRSAASAAQLGAALDAVAASKLAERSEPDLRAFLQQSGASGNVYISAEQATTLFQSEVLADMVGGAEALEVQLASGDVVIPTDVFLARAARMPNVDEIKRHVRARADDVSLAEVEAIDFDALAQQFGLEDTTEAAERAEPGTVDAREQVVQDVMGQLIATNRYTPAAAEAQAKLWGAAMDRLATMAGTDAWSLYQRYMGGIRSGRADGTDPLATRPWQGDGRLDALLDSIRSPQETSQREIRGPSLVEFLRANGGIRDEGGELRGMDAARQRPGLVNSAGMPLDRAREIVAEAGYFGDDTGESIGTTTISDLLDLIDRDLRIGDVFSVREGDRARQEFEADRDRLLAAIDEHPVLSSMPQEEFRALTNQQIADMLFGDALDQTAYHGTPHNVDRFSLQKIGTGEGAQAYGWGLYFAGRREVANHYRRVLSERGAPVVVGGKEYPSIFHALDDGRFTDDEQAAISEANDVDAFSTGDAKSALEWFASRNPEFAEAARSAAAKVEPAPRGNLYRVEIPEDSDLLDWDKPLSEQSEKVLQALSNETGVPVERYRESSRTGKQVYRTFISRRGSPEEASRRLAEIGIPGLRYLDGGSRGAGDGTHNYVIWDEDVIGEPVRLNQAANFDQDAATDFDPSGYRPEVVSWAKETYGDAIAPNGRPVWQNFVAWFGDSQAVDSAGKPLVVYHGSPDARFMGEDATFMSLNDRYGAREGVGVFWFAKDRGTASTYADDRRAFDYRNAEPGIIPAYLKLENPLIIDGRGQAWREAQQRGKTTDVIKKAQAEGHDGVIIRNVRDDYNNTPRTRPTDTYVVFNSRQIKAADGNSGAFDPSNPSILFQSALDQTQTPEFRRWFGDSKVVDEQGRPLVVYHGSTEPREVIQPGMKEPGAWFARSPQTAANYALGGVDALHDVYLSVQNPLVVNFDWENGALVPRVNGEVAPFESNVEAVEYAQRRGFDGVHFPDGNFTEDGETWVVFRPEQIKSATGNRGTFDPSNPSILYQSARVDEATGLPLNDDGTVTVYHHTSAEAAEAIRRSGVLRSAAEPDVYVTTRRETDTGYGDVAVPIRVNPGLLQLDDEFPGGRMDFRLDVGRPGGSIRVKVDEPAGSGEPRSLFQRVADAARGLFNQQPSPKGPRGQIQIFPDRRMSISLFETADRSTFLHESGHFFLEVFRDIAADPNASQQAKDDFETLLQWFGVESADQIQREHHEQFARGFEAYLMEGDAPSPDLRSVFASFKAWLVSIYRTLASLNVTLSDDVRGVMDRLLATEDEIESAQVRQGFEPMALPTGEAGQIGLTEKQLADYAAMIEAATEEARAEVTAKLMAAHDRARRRWYKEELAAVRAEVEAEFGSQPVHRAARVLAGGRTYADGTTVPENLQGLKLDRAALVDVYGEAYLSRLRGLYAKEGGTDQDAAAMALGFPSGDALVVALANRGDLQARVEAETQARMRERHGDPMTDGTLAEVAMDAVHNDARVRLLQRELDMLADLGGNPRLDARLLTGIARNRMAQTALRDIRPNDYLVAERKAARKATAAAAQGDYAEALQAKRQQALNAALYREARKAQERAAKTTTYLRKAASDKTRKRVGKAAGKHYVDALDAIFAGIEVRGVSRPEVARRASLREWVRRMQEEGSNTAVPEELLARVESERVTNLADMTVAEVEGLREAVENLLHLARTKNKLLTAKGQRDWEEAKAELIARLEQQEGIYGRTGLSDADRAAWDRVREFYAKGANWVLQPETLIEWLDGGTSGPFHDLLWEPSEAAEHTRERLNRMVGEKLQAAMAALPASDRKALDRRYRIESLDADISGHSILSALLNMGNAGNRDKLLRGGRVVGDEIVPFTPEQLAEMFSKLSRPQAELVQGIWDAVDLLWPEIVAMEERLNGIAPERVVATPFTVMTKDGPVALRGGYYPVMYDPSGARAGQFAEDEQAKRVLSGQTPVRATTSKGHTEARTDYAAPLLLDYHSVLTRHLDGVTGDIAWRQFLAQAYKVLGDADIRRMINNRIGPGAANGLQKAFERGATGNFSLAGPLFGPFQKAADATMTNLSSAALGFRVPLALANVVTAPILATARVKKRFLLKGFFDYYGGGPNIIANMRNNARAIHALSPMMLRRSEARSIELSAIIANLRGKRGFRAKMIELAMAVHQWIVPLAENAIWMAAYQQAQAGGADMAEAVRMADKAIRQTQTKHTSKDLAQAEGGYMRPLMMFAGPLVIINNRLQEAGLRGLRGDVRNWTQALGVWIAMAAGGAWVFELIMGRGPGDEDDDGDEDAADWLRWSAEKLALLPFAAFPILREIGSYVESGFVRANPLVEAGKSVAQFGEANVDAVFGDEEFDPEAYAKKAIRAAGVVTGIPTNQLLRSGEYLMAVGAGEHVPESPAAEAYYLMQGPPDDE